MPLANSLAVTRERAIQAVRKIMKTYPEIKNLHGRIIRQIHDEIEIE